MQYFWCGFHCGMVILRNLFEPMVTHKNTALPLQTFAAVISMICASVLTYIVSKESARHGMDIITAVGAAQCSVYCVVTHKKLERYKAKEYWILVEIFYGINKENIAHLSTKNITEKKYYFL
eukprot:60193_1